MFIDCFSGKTTPFEKGLNVKIISLFIFSIIYAHSVLAEDILNPSTGKIFMSLEQRMTLNKQRQDYLNRPTSTPTSYKKHSVHKKIRLPRYITVSALIIDNEGGDEVRVNSVYLKPHQSFKGIRIENIDRKTHKVYFDLRGRKQWIPVGYTYIRDTRKIVNTYKIQYK